MLVTSVVSQGFGTFDFQFSAEEYASLENPVAGIQVRNDAGDWQDAASQTQLDDTTIELNYDGPNIVGPSWQWRIITPPAGIFPGTDILVPQSGDTI